MPFSVKTKFHDKTPDHAFEAIANVRVLYPKGHASDPQTKSVAEA